MKFIVKILISVLAGFLFLEPAVAQTPYHDYSDMIRMTDNMARDYPTICSVQSLAKTQDGREIKCITIGTGSKDEKPGIAVIGGIEGSYIFGRELSLGFASLLLSNSDDKKVRALLDKITFYIIPDVSPDASVQFFNNIRYERNVNSRSVDNDRDFLIDEDPFEDLNNDGLITLIRVSDPAGYWLEHPDDKRIMKKADLSKGESGSYTVFTEGTDNDKDGFLNEDGEGGVSFNRNLTYDYEEFGSNSGLHPVSEPETKAVLDFLFDHFNIYVTFAFGPQDNLGRPMKGSEWSSAGNSTSAGGQNNTNRSRNRKITTILKSDEIINNLVSERYLEAIGLKGSPPDISSPGNFMDWSYFHYGRYSFSTPGWWFPVEKGENRETAFLRYAEENNTNDVFVPWTRISHPDFPGKETEVGGIKPFVMINPPSDKMSDLISRHYTFLVNIAEMHPEIEFLDIKTEDIGENVYRLSLKVHNKGVFATCAESGESNIWTRIMRLHLEIPGSQKLLSGQAIQRIPSLEGDASAEFSWLIFGKGQVKITAGAVNTGITNTSVELR